MKQAALFAGLAALATANAHYPHHQHHHERVRRGDDGIVTSWDITTEVTTITVTAGQDGPTTSTITSAKVQSPTPPAGGAPAGQQKDDSVNAQAVNAQAVSSGSANDPAAIQSSLIAEQNSKIAAQESINSHQMAINNAPQTGAPAASSTPQPASSQPPVQASSVQSSAAPAQTGGSSTSGGSGWYTAIGTYYGAEGGYGSCGQQLSDNGQTVALSSTLMANKEYCGKQITIEVDGGGTYTATVADTCPGCNDPPPAGASSSQPAGTWHIDIVQGWAHQIDPNIDVAGHANLKWKFN